MILLNKIPEQNSFRLARFAHFQRLINRINKKEIRVLDVGGTEAYWRDKLPLISQKLEITIANLPNFDARSMPQFADNSFDIVHSNSVIEHVGLWQDMRSMAGEVRRLAPRYFVQTPYYWFPIEPHTRTPFFHWMPDSLKFRLAMAKPLGPFWGKCSSVDEAMSAAHSARILDRRMFSSLFPDARIESEKIFGWTKSLMAIRQ